MQRTNQWITCRLQRPRNTFCLWLPSRRAKTRCAKTILGPQSDLAQRRGVFNLWSNVARHSSRSVICHHMLLSSWELSHQDLTQMLNGFRKSFLFRVDLWMMFRGAFRRVRCQSTPKKNSTNLETKCNKKLKLCFRLANPLHCLKQSNHYLNMCLLKDNQTTITKRVKLGSALLIFSSLCLRWCLLLSLNLLLGKCSAALEIHGNKQGW